MKNKNTQVAVVVSFTKIIAYISSFYSIVLFCMILMNLYRYFVTDDTASSSVYLGKNMPYCILCLGSAFVSAVHFYCIKKERYNWIIVLLSIFLITLARIKFETIYKYLS